MDEMVRNKRIEKSTKYRVLVNYLKELIEKEQYFIQVEKIKEILKALEEVE